MMTARNLAGFDVFEEAHDCLAATITLSDAQWHGYIVVAHLEVSVMLSRPCDVIESPITITHDTNHADRENFYAAAGAPLSVTFCVEYVYG